jgi:hypothetical protein
MDKTTCNRMEQVKPLHVAHRTAGTLIKRAAVFCVLGVAALGFLLIQARDCYAQGSPGSDGSPELAATAAFQRTGEVSVMDFGAIPDGTTDCTKAFQDALDYAEAREGGIVRVPSGRFLFKSTLEIGQNVVLEGIFRAPPVAHELQETRGGSILLPTAGRGEPDGAPFIFLKGFNAGVKGFLIDYPEWRAEDVPPVPYPPTISSDWQKDNLLVQDCMLLNSYEGIRFIGAGRHLIRNVYGYPSKRGIYVDHILDVGRIENVHFWPFGGIDVRSKLGQWINEHGVAIECGLTDWQILQGCFSFGYGVGYKFSESEYGSACGKMIACSADSAQTAVLFESINGHWMIVGGEFVGRWGAEDVTCVDIRTGARGRIGFSECAFWGPIRQVFRMDAPEGRLDISGCDFRSYDHNFGAIDIVSGKAIIRGSSFGVEGTHIKVGPEVISAIITGNQADPGLQVINEAGKRTIIDSNQEDHFSWPSDEARKCYRIDVGTTGDGRYLGNWQSGERAPEWPDGGTKRWSKATSGVALVVVPGVAYDLVVDVHVPSFALMPGAGIYYDGQCIAPFEREGTQQLHAKLPAVQGDVARIEIRSKGWQPSKLPGSTSNDTRELGVAVRNIEVRAEDCPKDQMLFNACTGR